MKKILILFLIVLSFSLNCKKKKNEVPLVIWNNALQGTLEGLIDENENKLPEITEIPEQSVATKGSISLSASFTATDCYRDELPISCDQENIDYSAVEYQLVNSLGKIIISGNLEKNGSFAFSKEIENGNYRLLTKDSETINWTHQDFNYTWNPVGKNELSFDLKAKKKYYTSGPAEISGEVISAGFRGLNGVTLLPPQKMKNVTVKLFCKNYFISETQTNENGIYNFYENLNNNNCQVTAKGEEIVLYGSHYKDNKINFRFVFNGYNPKISTQVTLNKIVLDWEPKQTSTLNVTSALKDILPNKEGFKVQLIDGENKLIMETTTDAGGNFSFTKDLPRDTYTVKISKDGFNSVSTSFLFESSWNNSTQNIDIPRVLLPTPFSKEIDVPKDLTIILTPKSSYDTLKSLNSILSDSWTPTSMMSVNVLNKNGKVIIPPGDWEITYSKTGYVSQTYKISNFGEPQIIAPNIDISMMTPSIMHRTVNAELSLDGVKDISGVNMYIKNVVIDNQELILSVPFKDGKFDYQNLKAYRADTFCYQTPNICPGLVEVEVKNYGIEKPLTFNNDKLLLAEGSYPWFIYDPLKTYTGSGVLNITKGAVWGEENKILISLNSPIKSNISGSLSNAFSLSTIGSVNIEIGQYNSGVFIPLKVENGVIKNRTVDNTSLLTTVSTSSANTGTWSLTNIPNGTYTIKYTKEGFETIYETITLPKNDPIFSTMISTTGKGNLSGTIVLPGGFTFSERFSVEFESPYSNRKPSSPTPIELKTGPTFFSNTSVYKVYNIDSGVWKMTFKAVGYETIICWVNIGQGQNNYDVLTAVSGGQPPHNISGIMYNAINNRTVNSPLTLTLRPGVGNINGIMATKKDGTPYPILTSALDGSFTLPDVPAGVYTLSITGQNWSTTNNTVVSSDGITPYSLFVSPLLNNDEMRVVLSWADLPSDLDSHLEYGNSECRNTDGTSCQVLWNNRTKLNGDLTLDVDVTNGFGPETISMKNSIWQTPRRGYTIYNWSQETSLGNSEATVKIFKNGFNRTFSVPKPFIETWWNVFCLGTDMSIIEYGTTDCQKTNFWNIYQ